MTSFLVLLVLFSSACASVTDLGADTDPKVDPDIMRILTELQNEVKTQKQLIISLQAEVTSHKTRILLLEELVGTKMSIVHTQNSPTEMQENDIEKTAQIVRKDVQVDEQWQKSSKGRLRPSRIVMNAEGPVAFQAHLNSDITHIGISQKIMFDSVSMNIGNGYHSAHGLFIAPRPGIYIFSGSLLAHQSKEIEMMFVKNGVSLGTGILANSYGNQGFDQGSATVVAQLNTGDEVWVQNYWPDDTSLRAGPYTSFMGCLIMEL